MKERILIFFSLFTCTIGFTQSFEKGDILIDLGIGCGFYGTTYTSVASGNRSVAEEGHTTSVIVPLKAQYGVSNLFSIGIVFQPERYIEDADSVYISNGIDMNNEGSRGSTFGLIGTCYLINKDKFNLNAELGIGLTLLNQSTVMENEEEFNMDWSGTSFTIGIGMKYYFTENFGFFANTNYNTYSFILDEISSDRSYSGTSYKTDKWEAKFNGAQISAGLAVKF